MKTLTSLYCAASAVALALAPLSLELSVSLFVAVGMLGMLVKDYSQSPRSTASLA